MRILNKLVVFTLIVMILTSNICFADVSNDVLGTSYEEAATRLGALGIMVGDSVGFRPNDYIKRSEFAAIVVRSLGLEETVKTLEKATVFSDIQKDHWALNYINIASSMGIVNGTGNERFEPDEFISYEQAVKMIVCALGYKPVADTNGGYPTGYMIVGNQEGITDKAGGVQGKLVSRGVVANMMNNALEIPFMIRIGNEKKERYVKSGTQGTTEITILRDKLKLNQYDVLILSADATQGIIKFKKYEKGSNGQPVFTETVKKDVLKGISINGLGNTYATILLDSKDNMVLNIKKDTKTTVLYDYIEAINKDDSVDSQYGSTYIENITLKNNAHTYDVQSGGIEVRYNGDLESNVARTYVNRFAKVLLKDSQISNIDIIDLTEGGIVTKVDTDYINYSKGDVKSNSIGGISDAESVMVILDGELSDIKFLKTDMLVDYWRSTDGKKITIVASSKQGIGNLAAYSSEEVYVDKVKYDMGPTVYYSEDGGTHFKTENKCENLVGTPITAYIAPNGEVRYIKGTGNETATESEFYGVVNRGWSKGGDYLEIYKDVGGIGKLQTYEVKDSTMFTVAKDHAKKIDGSGVYKFLVNRNNEITTIIPISWLKANNALNVPDAVKSYHSSAEIFYGQHRLTSTTLLDYQVKQLDNDMRIAIRKIVSYDADNTANYDLLQFVSVADAKIFSVTGMDGKFSPKLLNYTNDLKGKFPYELSARFENDIDDCKVMVVTSSLSTLRSDSKKYGYIQEINKISATTYQAKIYTSDKKTKTYNIRKENVQDALGFYEYGTDPKAASNKCFVVFVEGGASMLDDDAESVNLSSDGTAIILKVYDLTNPWEQVGEFVSGMRTLNSNYVQNIYKIDDSGLFKCVVNNGHVSGDRIKGNTSTSTGNIIDENDSQASVDANVLVYEANKDLTEFTLSSISNINTYVGNNIGDKVFYVAYSTRIKMIIFQRN